MEPMEASGDLFDYDVASARALVRARKTETPKLASASGEHNSDGKHKLTASISRSTADRLQQMAIATVAGEGNSISDSGHNAEDQSGDAARGVASDTCQRRASSISCSRSQTPVTEEGDSAANAADHVPQPTGVLTRTASLRASKGQQQKPYFHVTQHSQLQHKEDQAEGQLGQLAVGARASSPAALGGNHLTAGQPRMGAGGSTLLGFQAEQPGTCTNEDCQCSSEVDGAQQQAGMAAAEILFKQRSISGRPPKASAGTASVSTAAEQQPQQVSGSRLSAEEHRISLDEPFQTIGWPANVCALQRQAAVSSVEQQQQQQEQPMAVTWPEPAAGLRTRLSMRSVAYLEDLLEQTAQAAGSVKADVGKNAQPLSSAGVRAAAHISAALSGRLSVGNLIISPPMSRAASLHPAAGTSSPSKVAGAADAVQAAFRRVKPQPVAAEVPTGAAGVQALLQPGLSRLPGRLNSQHLLQRSTVSGTPAAAQASSAAHDSDGTTSNSVDDSGSDQAPDVWTAAAGAGGAAATAGGAAATAGAAAKLQNQKRVSYGSDTCSSPGSASPVRNQGRIGALPTAGPPAGMPLGGLYAGPLQSLCSGFQGQAVGAAGAYGAFQAPRKSDRQLGLETVQRIDAIFRQQSRPLQGVSQAATAANNSSPPVASEAGAAGQHNRIAAANGSNTAVAAGAAADERCTVAALCRGLRFDGDITLKEVAMAFQLRDAYDWDEDLEAASKAKAMEDPRLKCPKLLSCSPSVSNSSVCPDPEPVSGFFPRSTWMAGNGGTSPLASMCGVRPAHSGHEYHPSAAGGLAPGLVQRLHMQSSNGIISQPGSVSSSRRASLANSPINLPGHDGPHQHAGQLASAALHAAVSQQRQGPRGWAALVPGVDSDPSMQPYPYMPARGAGRGRGRKRKNADDSDDDYDPRKPSHQQEVYQRKHIDRRSQQQYHQQRMCSRMSRYGYSYQAMQQAYSAAAMQQAYMMQAASKSGSGLSVQQVQHIQQLQYMQQQAQMAMAAMDEQAAAAAAGSNGYEGPDGVPGAVPGAAGSVQPPTAHSAMQSPINSAAYVKQEQSEQRQGVQQLQVANQAQASAMQQQQHDQQQQQQERLQHVQPSPQQQPQAGIRPQQPVRRPSYVKRRLTADDAADWLQNNAPGGLLFHRQPGPPRLDLGYTHGLLGGVEDHDMGLQILSPTAVQPPPGLTPHFQQHTNGLGNSFGRTEGRLRRRTLAGLEYDIIHGHIHIGDGSTDDDEMDSDVSDPDAAYGPGGTGGRRGGRASRGGRGARGGRGRGRGRSCSLAMSPAPSPQRAAALNDATASPRGSCGSPGVHSGIRGRGRGRAGARGRSSAARGRSCLSSVALASQMDAVAAPGAAGAADDPQQQISSGAQPPSAAGEAAGAAANGAAGSEAARARGRGRGRGRSRASNGSAAATAGRSDGSATLEESTGGRRGRGAGSRGRGRVGRPPLSSYAAAPSVIAAAFPGQQHADLARDAVAYVSTTNGLSGQKKLKLDRLNSGVGSAIAAGTQQPGSEPAAASAKQGLAGMPSWFPAGLAPELKPAGTARAGTVPAPLSAQQIPQINHLVQKSLAPSRPVQLARASPALIEQEGQQQDGAAVLLAAGPAGGQSHLYHPLQQKPTSWGPPSSGRAGAQYVQNGEYSVEAPAQELSDGMNDTMMTDLACHESLLWSLVHTSEDCSKGSWGQA